MKKLGFGTMRLPLLDADDTASIDFDQTSKMADMFFERGFTYVDTAYPYHSEHSEEAVKKCITDRFPRERFFLADKMPILRVTGPDQYQGYFDTQRKRCGTEYFDNYLLHNLGRDRYINTEKFGGFAFMEKMKKAGNIRNIGFSFHDDAETLDRILTDHPEVDFVQLQINYLDWEDAVTQSGKCYETATKHGKPVVVMEPVKGGTLASLPEVAAGYFRDHYLAQGLTEGSLPTPASLAIRFAASLPNVMMVLSGMSSIGQMDDNTGYMQDFKPLAEGEKALTKKISGYMREKIRVACTSCRYCTEVCPQNINIPGYFGLLNLHAITGKKTVMYYERYSMNRGKAGDCLKCGLCEQNCPQHLPIRDHLKEFAALYEEDQKS
ncbi:MAG: aldo/keto reductase [Lachnospiraceae bacterium]|nr:aldo/keto reductase [Lachnospiraceae bacterium]